jgi:hypothetical protein
MMYVSVCEFCSPSGKTLELNLPPDPVAMSVRSTNVYEENSLGVFEDDDDSVDENFTPDGSTATVWSRYLALHMRKQLSFGIAFLNLTPSNSNRLSDMWWLALALFLVCIIEVSVRVVHFPQPCLPKESSASWPDQS